MSDELGLLHQILSDAFPAKSETVSLEYIEVEPLERANSWGGTFRLIVWEIDESTGVQSIRDVKEQQVYLGLTDLEVATLARFNEVVRALVRVLNRALAYPHVETLMPHDLIDFRPIKLVTARTEDDFVAAYEVKSRLGRYLP